MVAGELLLELPMTGDLELFLRGVYVNQFRCPHNKVTYSESLATFEMFMYCHQCGQKRVLSQMIYAGSARRYTPQALWDAGELR